MPARHLAARLPRHAHTTEHRRSPKLPPPARKVDLRKTLFLLPNIITLSSVFCGFDSIRISATAQADDDYYRASSCSSFAPSSTCSTAASPRLTKTQSAFGLQIDPLADAISFGVAPAILVYKWSLWQRPVPGLIAAFIFAASGVVRLARFNVLSMGEKGAPTKPGVYIVGLPVPGAAGILISLVLANHAMGDELRLYGPRYVWALVALTLFSLVSHGLHDQVPDLQRPAAQRTHVSLRGVRRRIECHRESADAPGVRPRVVAHVLRAHRTRGECAQFVETSTASRTETEPSPDGIACRKISTFFEIALAPRRRKATRRQRSRRFLPRPLIPTCRNTTTRPSSGRSRRS